jgi:microcin C transport system permease protein
LQSVHRSLDFRLRRFVCSGVCERSVPGARSACGGRWLDVAGAEGVDGCGVVRGNPTGVVLGVLTGAVQGFFVGKTDLVFQRFIEIWSAMPELYLLIIFSAVFDPSITLLLVLLGLFGWMGLSDYVRAEFLRNRQLDYVRAARALGLSNWAIIWRHILPNSMTPVVTFLPFRMSAAILALTSLDFLGLGVPPGTPSLGELLSQGKTNIDAWWISLSTFAVLVITLLLLTFMGDALRDALDPRKLHQETQP